MGLEEVVPAVAVLVGILAALAAVVLAADRPTMGRTAAEDGEARPGLGFRAALP